MLRFVEERLYIRIWIRDSGYGDEYTLNPLPPWNNADLTGGSPFRSGLSRGRSAALKSAIVLTVLDHINYKGLNGIGILGVLRRVSKYELI